MHEYAARWSPLEEQQECTLVSASTIGTVYRADPHVTLA